MFGGFGGWLVLGFDLMVGVFIVHGVVIITQLDGCLDCISFWLYLCLLPGMVVWWFFVVWAMFVGLGWVGAVVWFVVGVCLFLVFL